MEATASGPGVATDTPSAATPRQVQRRAATRLWLWNVLAAALLHLAYTDNVTTSGSARAVAFLYLGLVSNAFVLSLAPGLVGTLLAAAWPTGRRRSLGWTLAVLWTLLLLVIRLDTEIWGIFRYHINGMVLATITNPAAADAVHIGLADKLWTLFEVLVVLALELLLLKRLLRTATHGFRPSSGRLLLLLVLPIMLVEKGIYAHADLYRDRRVTSLARVLPLYQRLTVKRMFVKHFGFQLEDRPQVSLGGEGILLDYPLTRPTFPEAGVARPNILLVVIDSLRADAFGPEAMPHVSAFAADPANHVRVFEDHYSGGNATRFGLFSMLYGLHGSYWIPVYTEGTSPVLVDSLLDLDYELQVLSTASMNYPEFRSTAWVRIEDRVQDDLEGETPGERDASLAIAFDEHLTQLETDGLDDKPFFTFALLDAPHQTYSFPEPPPGAPLFEPYLGDIDYKALAGGATDEELVALKNRYLNAVLHADRMTAKMLDSLRAHGELEDTLVVITGDHGEEFWENGFWGHTSNFTPEQAKVPLLFAGPGVPAGRETRPTSHVDLAPTLLELLGADPAIRADWTVGLNLFDLPGRPGDRNEVSDPDSYRRRTVSGWDLLGIDTPGGILEIPTETHRGFGIAAWTRDWQPILDDSLLEAEAAAISATALECRRFLR
ncbi:MAG: sulfatase-like hydrolase/transferase [Planctomycetota bacterium]|nr:sulfatase-like hydrolase/transferase [Planctomycetota bacterium]